jgi:hypothetical protein
MKESRSGLHRRDSQDTLYLFHNYGGGYVECRVRNGDEFCKTALGRSPNEGCYMMLAVAAML